ncbi:MAG TPA: hypothetical protein VM029_22855 [Opitutaceae bacterium]|nr:hypothetical protein [Opitutaceae bacterium]
MPATFAFAVLPKTAVTSPAPTLLMALPFLAAAPTTTTATTVLLMVGLLVLRVTMALRLAAAASIAVCRGLRARPAAGRWRVSRVIPRRKRLALARLRRRFRGRRPLGLAFAGRWFLASFLALVLARGRFAGRCGFAQAHLRLLLLFPFRCLLGLFGFRLARAGAGPAGFLRVARVIRGARG